AGEESPFLDGAVDSDIGEYRPGFAEIAAADHAAQAGGIKDRVRRAAGGAWSFGNREAPIDRQRLQVLQRLHRVAGIVQVRAREIEDGALAGDIVQLDPDRGRGSDVRTIIDMEGRGHEYVVAAAQWVGGDGLNGRAIEIRARDVLPRRVAV